MSLWKQTTDPDRLNAWSKGTLVEHLGMIITDVGDDYVRGTMPVDARTRQPFGLLHGGASVALAESLGSTAGNLCLGEGEIAVGLDINANHLRAVTSGLVTGTARPAAHRPQHAGVGNPHRGRAGPAWCAFRG